MPKLTKKSLYEIVFEADTRAGRIFDMALIFLIVLELSKAYREEKVTAQVCPACLKEDHDHDSIYCKYCGEKLNT